MTERLNDLTPGEKLLYTRYLGHYANPRYGQREVKLLTFKRYSRHETNPQILVEGWDGRMPAPKFQAWNGSGIGDENGSVERLGNRDFDKIAAEIAAANASIDEAAKTEAVAKAAARDEERTAALAANADLVNGGYQTIETKLGTLYIAPVVNCRGEWTQYHFMTRSATMWDHETGEQYAGVGFEITGYRAESNRNTRVSGFSSSSVEGADFKTALKNMIYQAW